jgi:hypothetical protein
MTVTIYSGKITGMKKFLLPRLQDILFFSIFAAVILLGPRLLNADGDLQKHLTIGKYVMDGNLPPIRDIFSHTRTGTPFAPHKWLSGVLFYTGYILFDERGIVLLAALATALSFMLIYMDGVARTGLRLTWFFLVAWGAAVSSLHWIARPHLFTMLLLAAWLILNERLASGKKVSLWLFPALMLLWNNIHGEFISGFLVTLACIAGWVWDFLFDRPQADLETGKRLGLVLVSILAVTVLNPVSFMAWGTVTGWLGSDYLMTHTDETLPPDFLDNRFLVLLGMLAFSIFLLALKQEKLPARMAFILAGFTAMVLLSARNVHIYGVAAPFVLAGSLKGVLDFRLAARFENLIARVETRLKGFAWPTAVVLLAIILLAATPLGTVQRFSPEYFPIQAVEWLKTHPQEGEMFNSFDWGGYLSLNLWPDKRVFVDSQGDVYGETFLREYEQVVTVKKDWQAILDKYHVQWAILPQEWELSTALAENGWLEVYRDDTAVIYTKGE